MTNRRVYDLVLTLRSPFLFEGTVNTRTGVDSAYLRDQDDCPIIPSSQVRGVLRAAMGELANATKGSVISDDEIRNLFGDESAGGVDGSNEPLRACAIFGDLTANHPGAALQFTRIQLDESSGTVKRGSLQVIELAAPIGAEAAFHGQIIIRYPNGLDPARIERSLKKALALTPCIGAIKSAGFGEIIQEKSSVKEREKDRVALTPAAPAAVSSGTLWFDLTLDRPLIVDSVRVAENVFESASIIPGAAIKGALAQRLELAGLKPSEGALDAALEGLRVSHAFPVGSDGKRLELPLPLSLIHDGAEPPAFADAIIAQPGEAPMRNGRAAGFVASAKSKIVDAAREKLGFGELAKVKLSRTHVKIDKDRLSAEESKLFVQVAIAQKNADKSPVSWRFSIELPLGAYQAETAKILALLNDPLDGLGRSSAIATVTAAGAPKDVAPPRNGQKLVSIILLTPAMLTGPRLSDEQQSIFEAHKAYFNDRLGGAKLLNVFAARKMAGGYVAMRRRAFGKSTYYPFILTVPGSVFRLDVSDPKAASALDLALRYGLPAAMLDGKAVTWRNCPYVPENGYGEIALHDLQLAPMDGLEFAGGL